MKKQIAFVTGGLSGESVISYESAKTIEANVDQDLFDLYRIDIRHDGWFYNPNPDSFLPVDKNDFSITHDGRKVTFDAVLCGIHGTPGEDGKLQGYFDLLGLPYTACSVASSSITFNKRYTVAVAAFSGIPVAKSLHFFKEDQLDIEYILSQLTLPVFVKPNNGGSSIGMSKVSNASTLADAIQKAFKEDAQILIEEFISGTELTIGVYKRNHDIITLPITEIRSKKDFFDYEAKYTTGMAEEITPAPVAEDIAALIRTQAAKLYHIFDCKGVVRIDFIYDTESKKAFMLEINTVPGQSANSIVPQQVRASGDSLKSFYTALILSCLPNQ
ncbi:MAG: D-alanine--D-alanine ligase [Saprospiraceae bacterium]|jgi:D-alanine-D-alanine ligase|nr:D-alanine--D-alanine ligase [Saprospiraceae bacterium]MBK8511503.1 D-alanine--D-alanine ligase [Saprospiraceae bacterium]MBK9931832.1 D-alanine--D-alanine ligase [Saprospiraceae bacterium]MBP7802524.1 D-alanine--D-alanine ligase [Saprospiraceae bacterium]MBP8097034.1 D-alanine--D-alanine ligase [Saprospiraceae bacterium]